MDTFVELLLKAAKLYSLGMLKIQVTDVVNYILTYISALYASKTIPDEEIRLYFKSYMSQIIKMYPELEEELYKLIRILEVLENG